MYFGYVGGTYSAGLNTNSANISVTTSESWISGAGGNVYCGIHGQFNIRTGTVIYKVNGATYS